MIRIFHMESVAGNTVETKHCKNPMVSRLSNKYLLLIELLSESYSSMLDVLSSRRSAVRYHDILPHVGAAKPPDSQPPPPRRLHFPSALPILLITLSGEERTDREVKGRRRGSHEEVCEFTVHWARRGQQTDLLCVQGSAALSSSDLWDTFTKVVSSVQTVCGIENGTPIACWGGLALCRTLQGTDT